MVSFARFFSNSSWAIFISIAVISFSIVFTASANGWRFTRAIPASRSFFRADGALDPLPDVAVRVFQFRDVDRLADGRALVEARGPAAHVPAAGHDLAVEGHAPQVVVAGQELGGAPDGFHHGDVLQEVPEEFPVPGVAPDDLGRPEDLLGSLVARAAPEVGHPFEAEDRRLPLAEFSQFLEGLLAVGRLFDDQVVRGLPERRLDRDAVLLVHRHGFRHRADVLRFPARVVQDVLHPVGEPLVLLEHPLEEVHLRHVLLDLVPESEDLLLAGVDVDLDRLPLLLLFVRVAVRRMAYRTRSSRSWAVSFAISAVLFPMSDP